MTTLWIVSWIIWLPALLLSASEMVRRPRRIQCDCRTGWQIVVRQTGRIEVAVDGGTGVVHDWARALPDRRETVGLAPTAYGSTEAVVLTEDQIVVTVRPIVGGIS